MNTELILKRESGLQVKIYATVNLHDLKGATYTAIVYKREKGKRKWEWVRDRDSNHIGLLDDAYLKVVTREEIQSAKEKLWQLLKP